MSGCATTNEQVEEQIIVGFAPLNVATRSELVTDGLTPPHVAARDGEYATVKKLLQQGANVNATSTTSGSTALMLAATAGHEPILRYCSMQGRR